MIPYPIYKLFHFLGIFLVFVSLAAVAIHAANGGTREEGPHRKLLNWMHWVGVSLIVIAGFGMLSRIGVSHSAVFPGWVWAKIAVFTTLIVLVRVPYRRPKWAIAVLLALPLLGVLAASLALFKPF